MRLGWSVNRRTKEVCSYYAQKTSYENGKNKTIIVEKFGTPKEICEKYNVTDPKAWALKRIEELNELEKSGTAPISLPLDPTKDLPLDKQWNFNGGYLFLQIIYHRLKLQNICKVIRSRHKFEYNLDSILSRLIYGRILFPGSKRSTFSDSKTLIEQPDFTLDQVYKALSVLAQESDYIQSSLFRNSCKISRRNTGVIYYDCTNFFFEIEEAKDDRQYGKGKENRPLPIVEMGLFMDADGIPVSFCIHPGNTNEQVTMVPLEKKMIEQFRMSDFVVCTDAGLSSFKNRIFNHFDGLDGKRSFITTQSVKKLEKYLQEWMLDPKGWKLSGNKKEKPGENITYDISSLSEENDYEKIYYKSRWIKKTDTIDGKKVTLEQQLIVTFSLKYKNYLQKIRKNQVERAKNALSKGTSELNKKRANDFKRFIMCNHATKDGEVADQQDYYLDEEAIEEEGKYDGYYAVCTDLTDNVRDIVEINKKRWEIEECFRIMKTDFEARPVYLQLKERIQAHFITCFIALIVYRYLEKELDYQFTITELLKTLRNMNFNRYEGYGYVPTFTRTEITDALCTKFDLPLSKEIITSTKMRNICATTKKRREQRV